MLSSVEEDEEREEEVPLAGRELDALDISPVLLLPAVEGLLAGLGQETLKK